MSDEERNQRLIELFSRGAALNPEERRAFVDVECGEDDELRRELEALLQVEARGMGDYLEEGVALPPTYLAPMPGGVDPLAEDPGPPSIEGYRGFVPVGEGGMGVVYRAEQHQPVRRVVAVKVIRSGMDSRTVLKRFEVERQALARMSHAYIAAVYDAGADLAGRPFLVMEFVDGKPITDFCRLEELNLEERVELCAKVCEAVEHAHRRGVLHRDLKPTNVLVVRQDGTALPKIIDFGIAKSILGDLAEHTLVTQQGAFLGTPEYMAPEQFELDASRIDTRSDVYALGVLVYEVLTGLLPFDSDRLRTSGLGRMVSILQREVPPKPSTRLRALTKSGTKVASGPASDSPAGSSAGSPAGSTASASPTRWAHRLRGELDWVVMKALDKEPDRRYGTPGTLAEDLRRFLSHEPVSAGPPSGVFRVRRFVRRYRIQVAAGLLLLMSLLAGLTGTLWFLLESKRNEAEAQQRAQEAVASQRMERGSSLASRASLVTQDDPNLALLLALEAGRHADEYAAADAIYRALPAHDLLGSLNLRDKPPRKFEFLADGTLLVMTVDNVIWRIDHDRGAITQRYDGHTDRISDMAVAPELGVVATGAQDQTVRLWEIEGGACRAVLDQGTNVRSVAFSPDGRWLAALMDSGVVRVYDVESAELRHEFLPGDQGHSSIDFHPIEARLLLHSLDGSGTIRSLEHGRILVELSGPSTDSAVDPAVDSAAGVSTARFSPNGNRIVREFGPRTVAYQVQVVSLAGEVLQELGDCRLMRGALTEPHMALLNGQIIYLSLGTGEITGRLDSEPLSSLLGVAPDGERFLAVDKQLNIGLFDLRNGSKQRNVAGSNEKLWIEARVAFHPDGRRFTLTGPRTRIWSLTPKYAPLQIFEGPRKYGYEDKGTMAVGSRGALALALGVEPDGGSSWTLWNVEERRAIRKLRPPGVDLLYLSEDGERLLGREGLNKLSRRRYTVHDLEGRLLGERVAPEGGSRHWFHPNGSMIATRFPAGPKRVRLHMMDFVTGTTLWERELPSIFFLFDTRTGAGFATSHTTGGGLTDIFHAATGEVVRSLQAPPGVASFHGSFDAQNRRLLLSQSHKLVRSYDVDQTADEPTGVYTRLTYSDRRRAGFIPNTDLAWSFCSNEVHIFHAVTCKPFAVLPLDSIVYGVVAWPDGSEILTLTESGRCQRWPLNPMAVAERTAVEGLNAATLKIYDIGTPLERKVRERERLLSVPSPDGMARIGETALSDGDLDLAIDYYRRMAEFGPLGRRGGTHYRRRLELLCRRIAMGDAVGKVAERDIQEGTEVLEDCLAVGVPIKLIRTFEGFDRLAEEPAVRLILGL